MRDSSCISGRCLLVCFLGGVVGVVVVEKEEVGKSGLSRISSLYVEDSCGLWWIWNAHSSPGDDSLWTIDLECARGARVINRNLV